MYLDRFRLDGRRAFITGGARGIGLAAAEAFAEAGASVTIADRDADSLESARAALSARGYALEAVVLDVTDSGAVRAVADRLAATAPVDVLFANAGIAWPDTAAEAMTDDVWLRMIDINLNAAFWSCRSFGSHMVARGRGSIVTTGSMSGIISNKPQRQVHYNAAKAAVHHLTRSLAGEWARHGVRVNAIAPGYIDGAISGEAPADARPRRRVAREHADGARGDAGRSRRDRALPRLRRIEPHDGCRRGRRCRIRYMVTLTVGTACERFDAMCARAERTILGLVGTPGAGKSTFAARLVERAPNVAIGVPMDGFHLANVELRRLDRASRKGAPDTFDAAGYVALLRRLRASAAGEIVYAPEFRREIEEPIAGAIAVVPAHRVVVTEGNYLLFDTGAWAHARAELDEIWYVDGDEALRVRRLIARHVAFGRDEAAARAWVASTDEPNARAIEATRARADVVVAMSEGD